MFKITKHATMTILASVTMLWPNIGIAQNGSPPSASTSTARPGYLLVVGKTTDRSKIGAYASALPPIYASNDAYYLAVGGAGRGVTWLEGPWQNRSIILGKFPSRAQVDAFWWGDAYRAAIRKRDNAGVFSVVALEGLSPLAYEGVGVGFLIVMTAQRNTTASQTQLSQEAATSLQHGVTASGGVMLTSSDGDRFTSMEGDTVFNRFAIAAWPTLTARDAYLASTPGRRTARMRQKLGLSAVASADGVARSQAPPAATPQN